MTADAREVLIQFVVGALCAALVAGLVLRARMRPPLPVVITAAVLVLAAVAVLGVVEARVIAAVTAGSALGVLVAGAATLLRAPHRRPPRRILGLLVLALVAALPLPALELSLAGESMMQLTRTAAATSGGSWVVALRRAWELVLDPAHDRMPLALAWTVLLGAACAAVAGAAAMVVPWRAAPPTGQLVRAPRETRSSREP